VKHIYQISKRVKTISAFVWQTMTELKRITMEAISFWDKYPLGVRSKH
jgi:hypothetical protein